MPSDDEQRIKAIRARVEGTLPMPYEVEWLEGSTDIPYLLDRLAASQAREARLRDALEPLRAKLAPEWWREDEREWYVHCSLCAAYGPRDDFWHFEDCVLGQALAAAVPAAGGQPRDGEEAAPKRDASNPHNVDLFQGARTPPVHYDDTEADR